MNRLDFFDSIQGIIYPEMLVQHYDQFLALKSIVPDFNSISVTNYTEAGLSFNITYKDSASKNYTLGMLMNPVVIYGRPISVQIINSKDLELNLFIQ